MERCDMCNREFEELNENYQCEECQEYHDNNPIETKFEY